MVVGVLAANIGAVSFNFLGVNYLVAICIRRIKMPQETRSISVWLLTSKLDHFIAS